jgi:hypothetical protein
MLSQEKRGSRPSQRQELQFDDKPIGLGSRIALACLSLLVLTVGAVELSVAATSLDAVLADLLLGSGIAVAGVLGLAASLLPLRWLAVVLISYGAAGLVASGMYVDDVVKAGAWPGSFGWTLLLLSAGGGVLAVALGLFEFRRKESGDGGSQRGLAPDA